MEGISTEVVGIIYQLLPGFLVAWILYGLTAYPKPSPFERVVQALIFTVIVRAFIIGIRIAALAIGSKHSIGPWNEDVSLIWSVVIAIFIGLALTWCVNNDFPLFLFRSDGEDRCWKWFRNIHVLLTKIQLTNKNLHPTEWYTAFNENPPRYVVLHLDGNRRLYGWPRQYPDRPDKGHFLIEEAMWLLDDGTSAPLHTVKQMLISASEVEMVEFLKRVPEIDVNKEELDNVTQILTNLYKKEDNNANKCSEIIKDLKE
jgi:hypothetical protein